MQRNDLMHMVFTTERLFEVAIEVGLSGNLTHDH